MSDGSLPVVEPPGVDDDATDDPAAGDTAAGDTAPDDTTTGDIGIGDSTDGPTVWGVVLAAGTSSRYGDENKLLATLDGEPLVVHAARTLRESTVAGVTVVVGHEADRVRAALADAGLDVELRENEAYERGQSTSVREGVRAARDRGADAVLVALGDMPRVSAGTVDRLVAAYAAGQGAALAAAYGGKRGNPVLFDARFFDALADVEGDVGGRDILLDAGDAALVETEDPGVRRDVDRPADLDDLS